MTIILRTRTKGGIAPTTQTYKFSTNSGSSWTSSTSAPSHLEVGEIQTTFDVVTPNFRARMAAGEIINNPFSTTVTRKSHTFSSHSIRNTSGTELHDWSHGYHGPRSYTWPSPVDLERYLQEASTEAAARVETTHVDGLVEVGEAQETMRLFDLRQYSLQRQLRKELRYAEKRGYKFPVSAPPSVLANNWLMYRYGISPALALLTDTIVGSRIQTRRETARGFAKAGGSESLVLPVSSGGFHDSTTTAYRTWTLEARAGILYERREFTNPYGFSLANLPAAAWELAPYSFVADWFVNMGEFIRALTPRLQSVRRAAWNSYILTTDETYTVVLSGIKAGGYTVTKNQSGAMMRHTEVQVREPIIRAPSVYIRENALTEVLTSQRVVDAFALTTQLFLRLMRRT